MDTMDDGAIDVTDYARAFRTWARVARDPSTTEGAFQQRAVHDRALVDEFARWIVGAFPGRRDVDELCNAARRWASDHGFDDIDIRKSCLLSRLIYGREELRTRACPVHAGAWSGLGDCPAGCNYGSNLTGWLPNDLADEAWPARTRAPDAVLDALEAALAAEFTDDVLAVYADRLQVLGDPRGELLARDLRGHAADDRDRDALERHWLGALGRRTGDELRPAGSIPHARSVLGFLEVVLSEPEDVRAVFDSPVGPYLRAVTIRAPRRAARAIVRFLAMRPHRWLTALACAIERHDDHPITDDELAQLRSRAPLLVSVTVDDRG